MLFLIFPPSMRSHRPRKKGKFARKFEKNEWEWGEENSTVTGRESRTPPFLELSVLAFWRAGGNTENRRERKLLVVFSRSCSFSF